MRALTLVLLSSLIFSHSAFSSDHLDPRSEPSLTDMTDLFSWSKDGKLIMAINTFFHGFTDQKEFDGSVEYKFEIRPVKLVEPAEGNKIHKPELKADFEATISCRPVGNQPNCLGQKFVDGKPSVFPLAAEFAGTRADVFVLDVVWAGAHMKSVINPAIAATPAFQIPEANWLCAAKASGGAVPPTRNFSDVMNVLNLTLEIDVESALGADVDLVAVAAEAYTGTAPDLKRVDRAGRPEIMNMTVGLKHVKQGYNEVPTFDMTTAQIEAYEALIRYGVLGWDRKDGKNDWAHSDDDNNDTHRLLETLVLDALIVNTKNDCEITDNSFFQIELGSTTSCGGRTPSEDIIDTMFTLFTGGPNAETSVGDGISEVFRKPSAEFPYFPSPSPTPELAQHAQQAAAAVADAECGQ